ncbi:YbjQ family protein [Macrococcus bovicus]|uniref:UPF0145 protein ERX55_09280 n=1 Tax=Macrococcus bovicus TaxID=69968 RepID=A0A4R6BYD4_9STAP|nr:YbjQ family protein [Macrococcus bovicus]TDM13431.1 YbjQ family protein [Macrococcus bovicus]WJP98053.1 YbjQ family protein [Macrococcus bovicus]
MNREDVLVVTTESIANHEVVKTIGEVFGITVQSRDMFTDFGAGIRNMFGGEVKSYTTMLENARIEAVDRMQDNALAKGANAVLAVRFDSNMSTEGTSSVVAYGTAVVIQPKA